MVKNVKISYKKYQQEIFIKYKCKYICALWKIADGYVLYRWQYIDGIDVLSVPKDIDMTRISPDSDIFVCKIGGVDEV